MSAAVSTNGDFLSRLVSKATGRANEIVPRLPSVFEPPSAAGQTDIEWAGDHSDVEPTEDHAPEPTAIPQRAITRPDEANALGTESLAGPARRPHGPQAVDAQGPSYASKESPVAPSAPSASTSSADDRARPRDSDRISLARPTDPVAATENHRREIRLALVQEPVRSRARSATRPEMTPRPTTIGRRPASSIAAADGQRLDASIDAAVHPGVVGIMVPSAPLALAAWAPTPRRPVKGLDGPAMEAPEPAHVVNVTIGRVDVRAVTDETTPARSGDGRRRPAPMGLDQYLRQRGSAR